MDILLPLRIALRALRTNKMRSFLTMLGIIIGIGAVIVMVALGTGASRQISDQIASMGSNLLLVMPGSTTSGGIRGGFGTQPTLTYDDAKAIAAECPSVALAAATIRGTAQIVYGNMNWSTEVMGVSPEMLAIRQWPLRLGREFTQTDVERVQKVCIIGQTVYESLFSGEDPLGKHLRIKGLPFTVVGLLQAKGRSAQGTDQDDIVYIPVTTAQRKVFGSTYPNVVGAIMVQAGSDEVISRAESEINALLDQRHRIGPSRERDFSVRNLSELLDAAQQSSKVMTMLLGSVASISLIVGGIGIMNIMLVSVTERTREIGIRMAIGARPADILAQFLAEALLLTMFGGVAGIVFGVGGALLVGKLLGWPTFISTTAILVAVAFSSAIGVFFGFYPARKAAGLNPIDALRYE